MIYTQPATITWSDETGVTRTFSLTVDGLNAAEAQRLTISATPNGPPLYPDLVSYFKGVLNNYLLVPAIEANRPPAVQAAHAAYQAALATAIQAGQITEQP